MIRSDSHTHTDLSGDCTSPIAQMIASARNKGIQYYTITDHHDLDFPECGIDFTLDLEKSQQQYFEFAKSNDEDFTLLHGIEFGLQRHLGQALNDLNKAQNHDFIIGSCHLAGGTDPYDKTYFDGRTRDEGYLFYFQNMLHCVTELDGFDSLGHMDYVIRYWRGEGDRKYRYSDFSDIFDQILTTLIRKDIALEVNTAGYPYKLNQPHPAYNVLERYYQLGGKLITIGSDAHLPENVASHFDETEARLKAIGFDSYTVFIGRKPVQLGF